MPNLFNYNLIKSNIQKHTIDGYEEKHEVISNWKKKLRIIQGVNEVELQSAFLKDIFGKVLGYKGISETDGQWDMRIEASTEIDATKPDGILGFYTKDSEITQVVIELKGPKISLDKKQKTTTGKDYGTPVDQAFSYTSKYDRCKWVIVSNMIEIRLYKVGRSQEYYESFHIEELDDEKEFKKFHLLLCKDNLISMTGDSTTSILSERTKDHIQDISVEFYNLYRNTRIQLFEELKANNPCYDPEVLLEKAQKFLDRIIFICFCEDLGLLPNDLLHNAIRRGKESFSTSDTVVWEEIKGIFLAIDKGSVRHSIPAYDGGLFEFDGVLDTLVIKNDFFDVIYKISAYDFNSDLDANILGHIFEQSISDIEVLKADIQQDDYNIKKSRRKKEGIYYTPRYITKYIVENSLGKYLEDIREELGENNLPDIESASTPQMEGRYRNQHLKFYREYEERVKKVKVLDPACGSGAFLNQAFDFLLNEYRWIHDQISHLHGEQITIFHQSKYHKSVLQNNLYGVDLNEESVEITKLSLWLKTANRNEPLAYLDDNIKCGNSLIDDPEVAGDKAFKWEEEFSEIMKSGGFDIVIGNPPYVNIFNLQGIDRKYFQDNYYTATNKSDLYAFFVEKSIRYLLNNLGFLGFIVSNTWTSIQSFKNLRQLVLENITIEKLVLLDVDTFKDANVVPIILIGTILKKEDNLIDILEYHNNKYNEFSKISQDSFKRNTNYIFDFSWSTKKEILFNKMDTGTTLGNICSFSLGIKTSNNSKFIKTEKQNDRCYPVIRGRDISRYYIDYKGEWIWYAPELMKEKKGAGPRSKDFFLVPSKIILQEISGNKIVAALDTNRYFSLDTTNVIYRCNKKYSIEFILSLLNSNLINYWYGSQFKGIHVKLNELRQIPIPSIMMSLQIDITQRVKDFINFIEKVYTIYRIPFMITINRLTSSHGRFLESITNNDSYSNLIYVGNSKKVNSLFVSINTNILTIYTDKSGSGKHELMKFEVKDHYKRQYIKLFLENLTDEQLEQINRYSGNILEKVLQIKIPDYDKDQVVRKVVTEWNNHRKEIEDLKKKIEETDKEIDQMVYELYGLTEEEIKMVEEGTQES